MPSSKTILRSALLVGSIAHAAAQTTITLVGPVPTDAISFADEDKGSIALSAIGTGSDGTTYVEKQVNTVVYEIDSFGNSSRAVTHTSHISPITIEATVVVDATHLSYNHEGKLFPAETDAPDANHHEIQNCNFDSSGSGTCVDVVAVSTGGGPASTFTSTWSGPGRAWATITAQSQNNGARRDGRIGVGAASGLALFVAGGMMFGAASILM